MATASRLSPSDRLTRFFLQEPPRIYKRKQVILNGTDEPAGAFYITLGHVKVYSITKTGDEKIFIFYKPHEIFPLVWTFRGYARSMFFEAMDTVTIHKVSRENFMNFLEKNPEILLVVIKNLIDIIDIFVDRIDNLAYTKTHTRLVALLFFLARRFGKRDGEKIIISLPVTHQDLAATIAMTRETVSRDLERLIKRGIISQKKHITTIMNVSALQQELETCL